MEGKPFSRDLSDAFDMIVNVLGKDKIRNLCCNITIPDIKLFPSKLGYDYFIESFEYMWAKIL